MLIMNHFADEFLKTLESTMNSLQCKSTNTSYDFSPKDLFITQIIVTQKAHVVYIGIKRILSVLSCKNSKKPVINSELMTYFFLNDAYWVETRMRCILKKSLLHTFVVFVFVLWVLSTFNYDFYSKVNKSASSRLFNWWYHSVYTLYILTAQLTHFPLHFVRLPNCF